MPMPSEELTAHDWLQIEQAARGCVSGTSSEWPHLTRAIEKLRGKPFVYPKPGPWLQGYCEAVIEFMDIVGATDVTE